MNKSKRSQSQVIGAIILILISITLVIIVGNFAIGFVRDNLKVKECTFVGDSLKINLDKGFTYYDPVRKELVVSVSRSVESDYELSALSFIISAKSEDVLVKIQNGTDSTANYNMFTDRWEWDSVVKPIEFPTQGSRKTYVIRPEGYGLVDPIINSVEIAPSLGKEDCNAVHKVNIPVFECPTPGADPCRRI